MASEGPNSPTSAANDAGAGDTAWFNPTNALSSDDSRATVTLVANTSQILTLSGFGFSIPADHTVLGIVVEIEKASDGSTDFVDHTVRLTKMSVAEGDNKADTVTLWSGTEGYVSYGGASDLWGTTWTDTDVNDAGFGVVFRVECPDGSGLAQVNHVRVTVYYQEPWDESMFPWPGPSQPRREAVEVVGY